MATKVSNGLDLLGQRVQNVADPSSAQDAATKAYADALSAGLRWKQPVRVASTANVTISNPGTAVFDGVTLTAADRILLKNQTSQPENGIYAFTASGTAMTRTSDADSASELNSATVFVSEGSTNADKAYTQTSEVVTLGTTNVVFAQFGAGQSYTADGQGIELSGTQFALELDGTTLSKSSSGVRVGSGAAGAGLVEAVGVLAVGAGSGITVNADDVAVSTSTVARRISGSIGDNSSTSIVFTHNLATTDVDVSLFDNSTGENWIPNVTARASNTVTLGFATAPTTNQLRVVVN